MSVNKSPVDLEVRCEDYLKDNHHFYAFKAKRKKIAVINVEVVNKSAADVQLLLDESTLRVADRICNLELRATIFWKLSEFTWDFLLYLILDFHPLLAAVDMFFLLSGPLQNRMLKKQLHALSDGEMLLKAGESNKVLLGFRGVSKGPRQLQLVYCVARSEKHQLQCDIS